MGSGIVGWLFQPTPSPHHCCLMASYAEAERKVKKCIGQQTFTDIIQYVETQQPKLWSIQQPRSFYKVTTTLVLFHDLTGNGWQLVAEVTGTSFLLVHSTLNHNAKIIRRVLKGWALQWITPGTSQNWTAAARQSAFPKCIADATLLMDSFDLPTQKVAKTRGPKSPYWRVPNSRNQGGGS